VHLGNSFDEVLLQVVKEYNLRPHGSTGASPLELFLARPLPHVLICPDAPLEWSGIWGEEE
jgi:hypothetical protein